MPQNQKIGAVSVGSSIQNKSHFDYTNSVVTTHGFTEVQPEFFRLFETPGSMRLKTECEVRVAPINVPTFGLIQKKFWHYFFPLEQLSQRFANLYSATVSTAGNLGATFYTKQSPHATMGMLSTLAFFGAHCTVWVVGNSGWVSNKKAQYRLFNSNAFTTNQSELYNESPKYLIDFLVSQGWLIPQNNRPFDNYSGYAFNFTKVFEANGSAAFGTSHNACAIPLNNPYQGTQQGQSFFDLRKPGSLDTDYSFGGIDLSPVYLGKERADYTITTTFGNFDNHNIRVCFAFRFSDFGRRLAKIIQGIGWKLDVTCHKLTSLMPLFAYYACYYHCMMPELYVNFENTACKRLLSMYDSSGIPGYNWCFATDTTGFTSLDSAKSQAWQSFVKELATCFATNTQDFVSAHTATTAVTTGLSSGGDFQPLEQSGYNNFPYGVGVQSQGAVDSGLSPDLQGHATQGDVNNHSYIYRIEHGYVDAKMLQKLYKVTNIETVLGKRVRDLLLNKGYGYWMLMNKPLFIGTSSVDIILRDLPNSADTFKPATATSPSEGKQLGEWGANGLGYSESKTFKYKSDKPGYWFTLSAVVPDSGYCQGIDPNLWIISKSTGFQQEYDAVGYELNDKDIVCGEQTWVDLGEHADSPLSDPFGVAPRGSRFKVAFNKMNGDVCLGSEMNKYRTYILDKIIDPNDHRVATTVNNSTDPNTLETIADVTLLFDASELPICGTAWRYSYRYPYLGHLERIFASSGDDSVKYDEAFGFINGIDYRQYYEYFARSNDGFLSFTVFRFSTEEHKKQIGDSYQTKEDGADGKSTTTVGKA